VVKNIIMVHVTCVDVYVTISPSFFYVVGQFLFCMNLLEDENSV